MKTTCLLIGITILLTSTGCIISEGGRHHREVHSAVIVGPPVLVVHPPAVIIR